MVGIMATFLILSVNERTYAQLMPVFQDHFNDTTSAHNWNHTQDFRDGAFFQVIGGQFVRVPDNGHVFYYNNSFTVGAATYEFKAKGWWDFFWRGTTDLNGGKMLLLNNGNGTLQYGEGTWWPLDANSRYTYHNGNLSRLEGTFVNSNLTTSFNDYKIVDNGDSAKIYVNNQLVYNVVITPGWRNDGYIEIGSNHQSDPTAFDDIVVSSTVPLPAITLWGMISLGLLIAIGGTIMLTFTRYLGHRKKVVR